MIEDYLAFVRVLKLLPPGPWGQVAKNVVRQGALEVWSRMEEAERDRVEARLKPGGEEGP